MDVLEAQALQPVNLLVAQARWRGRKNGGSWPPHRNR